METEVEAPQVRAPEIKHFVSYREYIRDYYLYKKSVRPGFSYRLFASRCGIRSPNYLQLVIQNKRNLSDSLAVRVAEAMNLRLAEKAYFCSLVRRENAKTEEEKVRAERDLLIALKKMVTKDIGTQHHEVLGRWYHLLIRELSFLPEFLPTGEWISQRLRGLVTPKEAEESVRLLELSGFLQRRPDGSLYSGDPVIDTGPEGFNEELICRVHKETLRVWSENLDHFPRELRELGILNLPVSKDRLPELKERIRRFQDEIIGWLQDESQPDEVFQMGTYVIPMTQKGMDH